MGVKFVKKFFFTVVLICKGNLWWLLPIYELINGLVSNPIFWINQILHSSYCIKMSYLLHFCSLFLLPSFSSMLPLTSFFFKNEMTKQPIDQSCKFFCLSVEKHKSISYGFFWQSTGQSVAWLSSRLIVNYEKILAFNPLAD